MKISLENIADRKRIAVRLNNKEEARALLDEMRISYPNHVDGWDGPSWSRKYAEDGGGYVLLPETWIAVRPYDIL